LAEEPLQNLLDGQGGIREQLRFLAQEIRRLGDRVTDHARRQEKQHGENTERLCYLEDVVVKGDKEISLVRRIDRVQASVDQVVESQRQHATNRRWEIGDVWVPIATVLLASAATAIVEHLVR